MDTEQRVFVLNLSINEPKRSRDRLLVLFSLILLTDLFAPPPLALATCSAAGRPPQRATPSWWSEPTTPAGLRCSGTGGAFPRYGQEAPASLPLSAQSGVFLARCVQPLTLPSVSQLRQPGKTPPESPSSSHFRTIERQDSFDLGCEPTISCGRVGCVTVVRPQPRTQSLDACGCATLSTPLFRDEAPVVDPAPPRDLLVSFPQAKTSTELTSGCESASDKEESSSHLKKLMDLADSHADRASLERFSTVSDWMGPADINGYAQPVRGGSDGSSPAMSLSRSDLGDETHQRLLPVHLDQALVSSAAVSEGDSGIEPSAEGVAEDDGAPGSAGGSESSKGAQADVSWAPAEQQDKKKGDVSS